MLIQADARAKGRISAICPTCAKPFVTWSCRLRIGQGKFCSHSCSQKARVGAASSRWAGGQIDRTCNVCGAMFSVDPVQVRLGKAKYCSIACQHKSLDVKGSKNPQFKHGLSRTIEYRRWQRHRRRARVRGGLKDYHIEEIARMWRAQAGCCVYCLRRLDVWHVDHKTPLSRGGSNEAVNLQLLCPSCNSRKARRTHEEFLAVIAR